MATKLTKQQQQSLLSYRQLRRTVRPELYGSAVIVRWAGMWIGIEPDGYAHS